jgi:hypothetical protein
MATFLKKGALALRLYDFTIGIMAAGAADMVRALGLATVGAVAMSSDRERVVRTAHVAARRRGFSFRDRHGGKLQSERGASCAPHDHPPAIRGAKQAGWVAGKPAPYQAKNPVKTAKNGSA